MASTGPSMIVACPACATSNRVARGRLGERPTCGRCGQPLFAGEPVALAAATFDRHAGADLPLLIDFWADWCGPCRQMAPQFAAAAVALEPDVRLGKLDTEAEPAIAARFGIRSIPTVLLMERGRELGRQAGAMPSRALVDWVQAMLGRR